MAPAAPAWADWHARANARNKALENGLSRALCSGCHCTPATNLASGRLTTSIWPSRATASHLDVPAGAHGLDPNPERKTIDTLRVQGIDHYLGNPGQRCQHTALGQR